MPPPPYKIKGFERFSLKKKAFTLAETLITLTIIGVVAALTIPSLVSEYQKHCYVTGLKKAYSNLQNAVKMIPITEGCSAGDYDCAGMFDSYEIDGQNFENNESLKLIYLLSKQFKTTKVDLNGTSNYCPNIGGGSSICPCFATEDGMIFSSCGYDNTYTVDINGKKGPNKFGRDRFAFEFADETKNGVPQGSLLPVGSKISHTWKSYEGSTSNYYWQGNCLTNRLNGFCTGRVLEEDAMNY